MTRLLIRYGSGDPETSHSYAAIGLDCWGTSCDAPLFTLPVVNKSLLWLTCVSPWPGVMVPVFLVLSTPASRGRRPHFLSVVLLEVSSCEKGSFLLFVQSPNRTLRMGDWSKEIVQCNLLASLAGNYFFFFFLNQNCIKYIYLDSNEFDLTGLWLHYCIFQVPWGDICCNLTLNKTELN